MAADEVDELTYQKTGTVYPHPSTLRGEQTRWGWSIDSVPILPSPSFYFPSWVCLGLPKWTGLISLNSSNSEAWFRVKRLSPSLRLVLSCRGERLGRRVSVAKMSGLAQSFSARFKYGENVAKSTSDGFTFRVVSYNILAQAFVKSSLFPHSPSMCLRWKARSQAILKELKDLEADFFCIQELDEYDSFYKGHMETLGYSGLYVQRSGRKRDGCGIFYRKGCVELMLKEEIEYNDLTNFIENKRVLCGKNSYVTLNIEDKTNKPEESLPQKNDDGVKGDPNDPYVRLKRDNVGIMAAFKLNDPLRHIVILANTHLYWDPDWVDVKLAQANYLKSRLTQFKTHVSDQFKCTPSVIVTGDFNSTPGDTVYQFLVHSTQPADSSEEHLISLSSLYSHMGGEPAFTNHTPGFTGTLDYIFFSSSQQLKPISFLELPGLESADIVGGLPNFYHPSDHLPIAADFKVTS